MTEQKTLTLSEVIKKDETQSEQIVTKKETYELEPLKQYVERTKKIIGWVMSFTSPNDWVIYNDGVAYLRATGAERIATLMNITWSKPEYETIDVKDDEGKLTERIVICRANFILDNNNYKRVIDGIEGYSSTRDISVNKHRLPPQEVSLKELRKVAFSKMILEGIRRLLGIREIPLDYLPEKWRDKIQKVEFTNISEYKEYIHQWLLRKANGNAEKYKEILLKISNIPAIQQDPVDDINKLSNKAVKYIYKKYINKGGENYEHNSN